MVNYAAVEIGDWEKETRSKKVVKPTFTTDFPEAVAREKVDELTVRAEDGMLRTFIRSQNVDDKRCAAAHG